MIIAIILDLCQLFVILINANNYSYRFHQRDKRREAVAPCVVQSPNELSNFIPHLYVMF